MIHPHGAVTHKNGKGESPVELAKAIYLLVILIRIVKVVIYV